MDLRAVRTQKAIINAFLLLRAKKPVEKITVKELAEQAGINKATFYLHYSDLFALSEELEAQTVRDILRSLPEAAQMLAQPEQLSRELLTAFMAQERMLMLLFSGNRSGRLAQEMERGVRDYLFPDPAALERNFPLQLTLTVLVQGSLAAYLRYHKDYPNQLLDELPKISARAGVAYMKQETPLP